MAHQPWLIRVSHIHKLLRGDDPYTRWTTAELVQAFVLMSTFRALAGLVWGLGINPEVDLKHHRDGVSSTASPNSGEPIDITSDEYNENTLQFIDMLKKAIQSTIEDESAVSAEERRAQFEQAGSEPEKQQTESTASSAGWGEFSKCMY